MNKWRRSREYSGGGGGVSVNTVSDDGEIEATRENLMFNFRTEVGKMKDVILRSVNQTTEESINTGSLKPLVLKLR
ncbi:hypothetical protein Hanom_Chr13g01221041 [Helianthus anomalus]